METSNAEPQKHNFKHQFYGHSWAVFDVFNLHYLASEWIGEQKSGVVKKGFPKMLFSLKDWQKGLNKSKSLNSVRLSRKICWDWELIYVFIDRSRNNRISRFVRFSEKAFVSRENYIFIAYNFISSTTWFASRERDSCWLLIHKVIKRRAEIKREEIRRGRKAKAEIIRWT